MDEKYIDRIIGEFATNASFIFSYTNSAKLREETINVKKHASTSRDL